MCVYPFFTCWHFHIGERRSAVFLLTQSSTQMSNSCTRLPAIQLKVMHAEFNYLLFFSPFCHYELLQDSRPHLYFPKRGTLAQLPPGAASLFLQMERQRACPALEGERFFFPFSAPHQRKRVLMELYCSQSSRSSVIPANWPRLTSGSKTAYVGAHDSDVNTGLSGGQKLKGGAVVFVGSLTCPGFCRTRSYPAVVSFFLTLYSQTRRRIRIHPQT